MSWLFNQDIIDRSLSPPKHAPPGRHAGPIPVAMGPSSAQQGGVPRAPQAVQRKHSAGHKPGPEQIVRGAGARPEPQVGIAIFWEQTIPRGRIVRCS